MPNDASTREVPFPVRAALFAGALGTLAYLERKRPLRPLTHEPKIRREERNLAMAGLGAATLAVAEMPITKPLAKRVHEREQGLVKQLGLPPWAQDALAVAMLDFTLYLWHYLTHKAPFLWRFHQAHHVDLDMDASTGIRFHFGELTISAAWRAGQIRVIGVSPRALSWWQTLTILSVMFHHSDVELPPRFERLLSRFIVTPRMHGIHHSIVRDETDSNWSSGLTIWDWLHGTLRLDVPQDEITIGVPAFREPSEVTFGKVNAMPFREQHDPWVLPEGSSPQRTQRTQREAFTYRGARGERGGGDGFGVQNPVSSPLSPRAPR